jgi:MFS family permease
MDADAGVEQPRRLSQGLRSGEAHGLVGEPERVLSSRSGQTRRAEGNLTAVKSQRRRKVDWGRYGRTPVTLLALVAFIDSVDRGILPGVLSLVQDDLDFSDSQAGFLGSIAVLMSFVVTIPAGYMADRMRRTRVIAICLATWGAISALNATVRTYWQFLAVRAALGAGETIDNPASSSLMADYYPVKLRGRAYAYQRVAPTVGSAVGLAVAAVVGDLLGWRAAFLIVGVPGSILAFAVWRMREPRRGESDADDESGQGSGELLDAAARRGIRNLWPEIKTVLRVPSLRALMIGSAISTSALSGFGFWAATFYERHTSLGTGGAGGVVGAVILVGAIAGTILGGRAADRARGREPGAPMRLAATTQSIAAIIFIATFFPVPLAVRLPGQIVAVGFVVAAFPALSSMTSEVVPAAIRGIAFSVSGFLGALASAASPLLIGAIADQFPIMVDGRMRGNLQIAFGFVTPLILVGAVVVMNGRRHVAADIARVRGVDPDDLIATETAEPTERGPVYPTSTVVPIIVTGALLVLATVGLFVAARGGELPLTPWRLDGGIETAVIWAVCAYPLALWIGYRVSRLILRVIGRSGDDTDDRPG